MTSVNIPQHSNVTVNQLNYVVHYAQPLQPEVPSDISGILMFSVKCTS